MPAAILLGSYIWLALDRGTPWLWNVAVHESGRYTLGQTIFYFGHFLREIPTDVVYALFVLAAARGALAPDERASRVAGPPGAVAWTAFALAASLVALALFRSAAVQGWSGALGDLFQMRTRDDLVAYGSHWRFHWLSTLWFGVAAMLIVPRVLGGRGAAPGHGPRIAGWLGWGTFAGLTLIFGMSADTFVDVRYAGHQAREIVTHGPITGLLAIGVLDLLQVRSGNAGHAAARPLRASVRWPAAAAFVIIPLWLAAVTLAGDPMEAGQSEQGLSAMVAGHVFEHTLDYAFVALLVAAGGAHMMRRQAR